MSNQKRKTRPKKQHYISKHYLRNFCTKNEKLYVYNKIEDRMYWKDLEDVAEENYYFNLGIIDIYDSVTDEQKNEIDNACIKDGYKPYCEMTKEERTDLEHSVDDYYSDVYEPQLSNMILMIKERIINSQKILLTKEEKVDFAHLFARHYVRTKYIRDTYSDMKASLVRQTTAIYAQYKGVHIEPEKIKVTYTREQKRLFHISAILDEDFINKLTSIFSQYNWQFIYFDRGSLFLPDQLVNLCPTEEIIPMFPPSLTTYGMILEIPLSKRLLLLMSDSRKFKDRNDCEMIPFNILSNYGIKSSNRNSVVCAHSYVYSCDENALKQAVDDYKQELAVKDNEV